MKSIKAISFMMIFVAFATGSIVAQNMSGGIRWVNGFNEGVQFASSQKKMILVFFENSNPNAISVSLIRNTFTDPQVEELIRNYYVAVRSRSEENIISRFNIIRYPTLLVLDSTGTEEKGRATGIITTIEVINLLKKLIDNKKEEKPVISEEKNGRPYRKDYEYDQPRRRRIDDLYRPTFDRSRLDFQNNNNSYNRGRFEYIGEGNWIHLTSFYTVAYKEFSEDSMYYYLKNEEGTKYIALPKSKGVIWVWEENAWRSIQNANVIDKGGLKDPSVLRQDNYNKNRQYNPQRRDTPIIEY